MSFDLYRNGKSGFHSHLMEMSEYFNIPDFNTDISYWQNTLHHSQNYIFFRSFKSDHASSNCLDLTRETAVRERN